MSDSQLYAAAFSTKLSDFQRGYIKALYDSEEPVINIAQHMKIGLRTVYDMINKKI